MALGLVPIVFGGGAAALILAKGESAPASVQTPKGTGITFGAVSAPALAAIGSSRTAQIGRTVTINSRYLTATRSSLLGGSTVAPAVLASGGDMSGNAAQTAIRQRTLEVEAKAKAEYDKMSCEAKAAAGKVLAAKYGVVVDCNTTWADVLRITAAAMAAAGAGAACAATGIGTTVAGWCAAAGAYLGTAFAEWANEYIVGAADWLEEQWDDAKSWSEETAGAAYDEIDSWF